MSLAVLYHAHHQAYTEDLSFWLAEARKRPGPCLELGCGTGRVLLPLAEAGLAMTGLDKDAGMLAFLQARLSPALRERLGIIQADLTAFKLAERYATILLPCNTYSTLLPGQRRQALACIREHLLPTGRFIASLPNPVLLAGIADHGEAEVEETFEHPETGLPVQVSSAWERSPRTLTLYWHYDQLLPDGQVARSTASTCHYLETAATYESEFQAAGLQLLARYGDFAGHPYRQSSAYLILVAQPAGK